MRRIVIINPKGGCGKTTIAVNLAGYFAARGDAPVLMDYDPQGSAMRWFRKRSLGSFTMHGVAAYERDLRTTRTFRLRIPPMASHIVVDTPAALDGQSLPELTRDADKIIVPVLPSDIDVHACTRIIADLLLVAKIRRAENRIGVVANRVKRNTLMYRSLQRFLATLNVPVVATLRDSQNYVRSAELGEGIHEMKRHLVADDLAQWQSLLQWLDAGATPAQGEASGRWARPCDASEDAAAEPLRGPVFGKTAG
jgi:chromosome partitioning protein